MTTSVPCNLCFSPCGIAVRKLIILSSSLEPLFEVIDAMFLPTGDKNGPFQMLV